MSGWGLQDECPFLPRPALKKSSAKGSAMCTGHSFAPSMLLGVHRWRGQRYSNACGPLVPSFLARPMKSPQPSPASIGNPQSNKTEFIHVKNYKSINIYTYTYKYTYINIYIYICMYICVYVNIYIHIHICVFSICMCIYIYVCIYIYSYMYTHVYIHFYTYIHT